MRLIKYFVLSLIIWLSSLSSSAQPLLSGGFVQTQQELLLDSYPNAAAAYSVRKLSSTYKGDAMQVRRSSDNDTLNIGFINNLHLDTISLKSFCAATDCFVRIWYDQSGNGINAQQTTASLQPLIVSSGSINTLGTLAKPAINFNSDYLDTPSQTEILGRLDYYATYNVTAYSFNGTILLGSTTSGGVFYQHISTNFLNNTITTTAISVDDSVHRLINPYNDIVAKVDFNNTTYSAGGLSNIINSTPRVFRIGAYPAGSNWNFIGNLQELVIYSGKQAGKADIKSNINSYYSIY